MRAMGLNVRDEVIVAVIARGYSPFGENPACGIWLKPTPGKPRARCFPLRSFLLAPGRPASATKSKIYKLSDLWNSDNLYNSELWSVYSLVCVCVCVCVSKCVCISNHGHVPGYACLCVHAICACKYMLGRLCLVCVCSLRFCYLTKCTSLFPICLFALYSKMWPITHLLYYIQIGTGSYKDMCAILSLWDMFGTILGGDIA